MTVDVFDIVRCSFPEPLEVVMLDIDDTCDSAHGHRRLAKLAPLA